MQTNLLRLSGAHLHQAQWYGVQLRYGIFALSGRFCYSCTCKGPVREEMSPGEKFHKFLFSTVADPGFWSGGQHRKKITIQNFRTPSLKMTSSQRKNQGSGGQRWKCPPLLDPPMVFQLTWYNARSAYSVIEQVFFFVFIHRRNQKCGSIFNQKFSIIGMIPCSMYFSAVLSRIIGDKIFRFSTLSGFAECWWSVPPSSRLSPLQQVEAMWVHFFHFLCEIWDMILWIYLRNT